MGLIMLMAPLLLAVSSALIVANLLLAKKESSEREKPSPFECGFDPISSARLPFSTHFFLVAVIFLIFDVEITIILPVIPSVSLFNLLALTPLLSFFLLILWLGLVLEWNNGALEWYL